MVFSLRDACAGFRVGYNVQIVYNLILELKRATIMPGRTFKLKTFLGPYGMKEDFFD